MGLCASKPATAAKTAPEPAPSASRPSPVAEELDGAEEMHDTVAPTLVGVPSAAVGALDVAAQPSVLLRNQQSVVGALPVFTKQQSNPSRRGLPISDLPPASPAAAGSASASGPFATLPPPPPASASGGNGVAADADASLGRRSKGYDPLERPSRSALRSEDGGGGAVASAADASPGDGATSSSAPAPRKSLDASSSVKFRGLPPPPPPADGSIAPGAAVAAIAAATTAAAAAAATTLPASPIDAEAADPETSVRRARLNAQSKTFSMRAVVDRFYERVMSDPLLRPFFERVDEQKLKRHQEAAFALAFGGQELLIPALEASGAVAASSSSAKPSDLRAIHRKQIADYGLGFEHFDAFLAHFKETVEAMAIPEEQQATALAQLGATRPLFAPLSDEEREQLERERGGGGRGEKGGERDASSEQRRAEDVLAVWAARRGRK